MCNSSTLLNLRMKPFDPCVSLKSLLIYHLFMKQMTGMTWAWTKYRKRRRLTSVLPCHAYIWGSVVHSCMYRTIKNCLTCVHSCSEVSQKLPEWEAANAQGSAVTRWSWASDVKHTESKLDIQIQRNRIRFLLLTGILVLLVPMLLHIFLISAMAASSCHIELSAWASSSERLLSVLLLFCLFVGH